MKSLPLNIVCERSKEYRSKGQTEDAIRACKMRLYNY